MADDAPPPALTPEEEAAAKAARIAKGHANLVPIPKGETRNPTGINGRKKQAALIRWLEEASEAGADKSRIERVWQAMYLEAIKGDVNAGKALMEQHGGKARQQIDLSSEDGTMSPARADEVSAAAIAMMEAQKNADDGASK
jgi:hypothetical protein